MKTINNVLNQIELNLDHDNEKEYFQIHISRYQYILNQVKNLYPNPKGLKSLDIGCYPPHIFDSLNNMGFETYGISSLHEKSQRPNVSALNIESDKLPFESNYFDLIIFTEVLEHLKTDPTDLFKEIKRVLKPNGAFIITTPNAVRSQNIFRILTGKNIYFSIDQLKNSDEKSGTIYHRHNREFTLNEILELLNQSGLKICSKKYFISYTPNRKRNKKNPIYLKIVKNLNYLFMLFFAKTRDTIFILASKTRQ